MSSLLPCPALVLINVGDGGATDGMLLVYLPGYYLHLIDAGAEHEPSDSLMLSGADRIGGMSVGWDARSLLPAVLSAFHPC